VRSEKAGRVRTCRLEQSSLQAAEKWFSGRREQWERHIDRLAAFLDQEDEAALAKPKIARTRVRADHSAAEKRRKR
jgi:hypothetical protein